MPGIGPPPKDPSARARNNPSPRAEDQLVLAEDGEIRGPDLPENFTLQEKWRDDDRVWHTDYIEHEWPEATKKWWDHWRKSAIAQTFLESDWDFLLETARLHAQFWLGDNKAAAELRLRVSKFGATPEDRLRLRLSIEQTPKATPKEREAHESKSRKTYGHLHIA